MWLIVTHISPSQHEAVKLHALCHCARVRVPECELFEHHHVTLLSSCSQLSPSSPKWGTIQPPLRVL